MRRLKITRNLGFSLAAVNAAILAYWTADLAFGLKIYLNASFVDLFDPDREGNAIVWYSSFLLTLLAVSALVNFWLDGIRTAGASARWRFAWLGVGLVALGLSLEEVAQIHEVIQTMVKERTSSHGIWSAWVGKTGRAWLIPYLPVILAVVVGFFLTFRHMFRERRGPFLLATGALVLWIGALLLEFFLGEFLDWGYYDLEVVLEEAGEILGTSTLLLACVWYGEERWQDVTPAFALRPSAGRSRETRRMPLRELRFTRWLGLAILAMNSLLALLWIIGLSFGISVFPNHFARIISPALDSNFTTWYSGLLLTLTAFAAAVNFFLDSKTEPNGSLWPFAWLAACGVATFLSLEELARIHQQVEGWVKASLAGRGGAAGWIAVDGRAWLIPYLPFVLAAVVGLFALFLRMFQSRPPLLVWASGGLGLWLLSLILVFFASEIGAWGPWVVALKLVLKESAEILGSSILLLVCVSYAEEHWSQMSSLLDRPPGAMEPSR